jgi:hypothetical protein
VGSLRRSWLRSQVLGVLRKEWNENTQIAKQRKSFIAESTRHERGGAGSEQGGLDGYLYTAEVSVCGGSGLGGA